MTKAEKAATIEELKGKLENNQFLYLADSSTLTVEKINEFRKLCFEKNIEIRVVKNTLLKKALESFDESRGYEGLYEHLSGPTAVLFTEVGNAPAKVIKEFRKVNSRPILKAAYIDTGIYVGDDQIDSLASLKSKEDLIGDIISLLQSPAKNVVSALKSGGNTLSGLVKALEERAS